MRSFSIKTALLAAVSSLPTSVLSYGYNAASASNYAVYWGQNSAGGTGTQARLASYCENTPVNIIPISFLTNPSDPAVVNFGTAGDSCTKFSGNPNLLNCPQIAADIKTCQSLGKQVILSIGGATYDHKFASSADAAAAATNVWHMFGPKNSSSSVDRPFGEAVVDGFDFDFESTGLGDLVTFGTTLRAYMDAATDKKYILTAAPQCPYPDANVGSMLADSVYFDFIMVQFYNNYCGVNSFVSGAATQTSFNIDTWHNWAITSSKNPDVKILIGIPASQSAAGSGYVGSSVMAEIFAHSKQYSSFGGVMMWDMSQLYANSGFMEGIASALDVTGSTATATKATSTAVSTSAVATATSTKLPGYATLTTLQTATRSVTQSSSRATVIPTSAATSVATKVATSAAATSTSTTGGTLGHWQQCGGTYWGGSGTCASPYTCSCATQWFCMCT